MLIRYKYRPNHKEFSFDFFDKIIMLDILTDRRGNSFKNELLYYDLFKNLPVTVLFCRAVTKLWIQTQRQ